MNSDEEHLESADDSKIKPSAAEEVQAPFPTDDAELIAQAKLIESEDATPEVGERDCPQCKRTIVENWLPQCPDCGASLSNDDTLSKSANFGEKDAGATDEAQKDLAVAFEEWFRNAKEAYRNGNLEEAQADLRQAILRAPKSESASIANEEVEARELLAMILEKLGKVDEANLEYRKLADAVSSADEKNKFSLLAKNTGGEKIQEHLSGRTVKNTESAMQTLFCGACKRPLLEAEIYAYKRSRTSFRCVCGFEGSPLTYSSTQSSKQYKVAAAKHRALLIAAASPKVDGGRNQTTSVILACLLGGIGAHKFYLGEYLMGSLYLILCWTLIPATIAILDAIHLANMSRVTFNLTYNLESILERLPEDLNIAGQTHSDLLSMQRGEDALPEEDVFEAAP